MNVRMSRRLAPIVALFAPVVALSACPSNNTRPPVVTTALVSASSSASAEAPLGEVTLQSALEAAWDGDFTLCHQRARTALSIAADDLETMELMMRCAAARKALPEAVAWVKSAYAVRLAAPVTRYGLGIAAALKGDLTDARKTLEKLVTDAPAAAFQAALIAQIEDDPLNAERFARIYVASRPTDPAGRALHTRVVCALDLVRCQQAIETIKSNDDDETAIARRLGAATATPFSPSRERLASFAHDAETIGAAAWADHFALAATVREGGDPAALFVRSPRSGRPEPGATVDLVREARPIPRLPFHTRVMQLGVLSDPAAPQAWSRMAALFPTELDTYRLAARWDKTAAQARKELEKNVMVRFRAVLASPLATKDEACELSQGFSWSDRGPVVSSLRVRCEASLDANRARKIGRARLDVLPFGVLDVEVALEAELAGKPDPKSIESLIRHVMKTLPQSTFAEKGLVAAGDLSKKPHALWMEACAQVSWDPSCSRRVLRRYVELKDVTHAKSVLPQALVEAPLDALLCGVQGEILVTDGKSVEALPWLTKACVGARARRDHEVLQSTLATMHVAIARTATTPAAKPAREPALKCMKGEP